RAAFGSSPLQPIHTSGQNAVISQDLFSLAPESGNFLTLGVPLLSPAFGDGAGHTSVIHITDVCPAPSPNAGDRSGTPKVKKFPDSGARENKSCEITAFWPEV